ncbi:MAG: hypothetical protein WC979_03555 [Candidatus Pacearchaeota archaeon]|jgi:hypothetical protein
MKPETEELLIEAIQSIAEDIHKIKNSMCEEEGKEGIYVRGDIGCHQD